MVCIQSKTASQMKKRIVNYNQEENQSTETDPGITEIMEFANKDLKKYFMVKD